MQSAASPLRHVASVAISRVGTIDPPPEASRASKRPIGHSGAPKALIIEAKASTSICMISSEGVEDLGVSGGRLRDALRGARQWLEAMARRAKRDGIALYLAARHPRVAWPVKAFAVLVAAYVLSPIDLIPDFIPVIGFLDELILLPLLVGVIVRFVDPALMADLRAEAERLSQRPQSRLGLVLVLTVWVLAAGALTWALWRWWAVP